jgi:ubiquinone/menaquinone biosynthesis C-methylase UbiE
VGIYSEQVVPRIVNFACGTKEIAKVRAEACAGLSGDVLEIGFGSGLSLPYFPKEVTGVWTVDPSTVGMKLAAKRIVASPIPVHTAGLDGAHLDLPDDRFDGVLSIMTLCTIPDVTTALDEVRRVLKPGASLHFADHGLSPDAKVARFQTKWDPWQQRLFDGCHVTRDIAALVSEAGFAVEDLRNFYMKGGPKAAGYMFVGRARKP